MSNQDNFENELDQELEGDIEKSAGKQKSAKKSSGLLLTTVVVLAALGSGGLYFLKSGGTPSELSAQQVPPASTTDGSQPAPAAAVPQAVNGLAAMDNTHPLDGAPQTVDQGMAPPPSAISTVPLPSPIEEAPEAPTVIAPANPANPDPLAWADGSGNAAAQLDADINKTAPAAPENKIPFVVEGTAPAMPAMPVTPVAPAVPVVTSIPEMPVAPAVPNAPAVAPDPASSAAFAPIAPVPVPAETTSPAVTAVVPAAESAPVTDKADKMAVTALPVTAPAPVTAGTEADAAKIAALEKRLESLEQSLEALRNTLAATGDSSQPVKAHSSADKETAPAPKAQKKAARPVHKAAAPKSFSLAPEWVLKSAKPGSAMIAERGSNELRTIHVGDTLAGVGKIESIGKDEAGRWVVAGSRGRISQ
jgi:hypothetical protein